MTRLKMTEIVLVDDDKLCREIYSEWYNRFIDSLYESLDSAMDVYQTASIIYAMYDAKEVTEHNGEESCSYLEFPNEEQRLAFLLKWG